MTWAPVPLEIVATTPGDLKLERRIHGIFAAQHSHREWFNNSPELTHLIAALSDGQKISDLIDLSAPIQKFRIRTTASRTSSDRSSYLSYSSRVRCAFQPLWKISDSRYVPHDVEAILSAWFEAVRLSPPRYGIRTTPKLPTPSDIARLEQVISAPSLHALTSIQKYSKVRAA